jgi:hypothetical protein
MAQRHIEKVRMDTLSVTAEPASSVHVLPSVDVYAVNVPPLRVTLRYWGTTPLMMEMRCPCI